MDFLIIFSWKLYIVLVYVGTTYIGFPNKLLIRILISMGL